MSKLAAICIAFLAVATWQPPAGAFETASTGVVVVHGKWGRPGDRNIGPLATALHAAGFAVDQPEMPWSGTRLYDRGFDAAMDDIDAAAERLKTAGAQRVVVIGHSLGATAVLRYAALHRPVAAVVIVAPAHFPDSPIFRQHLSSSLAQAQAMVAAGRGDEGATFVDLNSGDRSRSLTFKAIDYLSYNGPESHAAMSNNAPEIGPLPLLWIAPRFDPATGVFGQLVWPRVRPETPATRIDVNADHLAAPMAGRETIVEWLAALP